MLFLIMKGFKKFDYALWICSLIIITVCFLIPEEKDYLTLAASLIGVTALIFIAKGKVAGQVLTVIFAVFYGVVSFFFKYYGEMITYLGLSAPAAVLAIISWVRHTDKDRAEVKVSSLTKTKIIILLVLTVVVTVAFYFILDALNTANLIISTVSVATSFLASALVFLRSPYYALAYAANDVVLIVMWSLASVESLSYIPMAVCFGLFLISDIYGYICWRKMKKRQQ